jgi:hypothetical protein
MLSLFRYLFYSYSGLFLPIFGAPMVGGSIAHCLNGYPAIDFLVFGAEERWPNRLNLRIRQF